MKKLILAFLLSVSTTFSFAENGSLKEYSEVVEINNTPQKTIYDAAKIWVAKSFKSSNSVIQYEDATTGTILGKGNMAYPCKGFLNCIAHEGYIVFFTLKIDTKDNKARVTFSDMSIKVPANSMMEAFEIEVKSQADKTNVEQTLKQIISTFQTSVQQASVDTNW